MLSQKVTPTGFQMCFRVKNNTKETLDLENTAAQFTDTTTGAFREDRLYQTGTKSRWVSALCYLTSGEQTDLYPCYVVTSAKSTVLKPGAAAEITVYLHLPDEEEAELTAVSLYARCGGKTQPIPNEDNLFVTQSRTGTKQVKT